MWPLNECVFYVQIHFLERPRLFFFKIIIEENRIFGNIVELTRQNWFYETSKNPRNLN